jgi:serine/threonine protein kinase
MDTEDRTDAVNEKVEQVSLETPRDLRDETPRVGKTDSVSELPDDLLPNEVAQAREALAFLKEVRGETQQSGQLPTSIGRYSIIRSLGRGGFAEVFLAEDEELDRRVALKVPLFNSTMNEAGRQRFEREAKLAASLGHPQIIPVYEYGDLGPVRFIAFAWCDGPNLTDWIANNGPVDSETAAKIVRFLADAVQHAHLRGIVHRDLKPGNVLVDDSEDSKGKPVWERLRITDFGLARNFDNHDATLTQDGQLVGTPAYMAPEQAGSGADVGTAADVWALGMMLLELLTGQLPFRKPEILATIRAICDDAVPRARKLQPNVPVGLDAIADLCLRKSPSDRYESAHDLSEDLRRWSSGEPVKAKPQSALSTFAMWTRRNSAIAAVSALAFLFLALGLVGTTWQYLQAAENLVAANEALANEQQALKKEREALEVEQTARIKAQRISALFSRTYRRSSPGMDGRQLKVVDMLDLTAEKIGAEFADDQETKWELQYELAKTYRELGVYEPAADLLKNIYEELIDSDYRESEKTLSILITLQRSLHDLARYEQANQAAEEAVELANKLDVKGMMLANVLYAQGTVLEHDNKQDEALVFFERSITAFESDENCELIDTLPARTALATCQRMLGLFEKAAEWMEPVATEALEKYGNNRPQIATLLQEYASVLLKLKNYEKAIEILEQQLTICNEMLGPEHGRTQQIKGNLASTLTLVGRRGEAIDMYQEVINASEKAHGVDSPHVAVPRLLLGQQLVKVDKLEEAESELQKSYDVLMTTVGANNPWTGKAHQKLVWLWFRTDDWDKTVDHFVDRAKAFDKLAGKKAATMAAVSRIEAGQAMIRDSELEAGLELIEENLTLLQDSEKLAFYIHYHSPVLSALVDRSEFEEAVPYAEEYLDRTPLDYQHATDVCSSRILAAAIGLRVEAPFTTAILSEVDLDAATKLNTEQWLLLSTSMKILESELENNEPTCARHRELISSLLTLFRESVAIP